MAGEYGSDPRSITSPLLDKLGIQVVEAQAGVAVATMPVETNTQVVGLLHGGATAALAETVASVAASVHAYNLSEGAKDAHQGALIAVGTEITISHLRSVREGLVTASAQAVHLGRRRTVHLVRVEDEDGRLVATAQATNMIVAGRPAAATSPSLQPPVQ